MIQKVIIRKENVTNQTSRVGHIKSKVYDIKSRNFQGKPRTNTEVKERGSTIIKKDEAT